MAGCPPILAARTERPVNQKFTTTVELMARRHWTIMVVPDDQHGVRQYRLSSRAIESAAGGLIMALVVLMTAGASVVARPGPGGDAEQLARANELLVREVIDIRREMSNLESALMELSGRDERYRILANLEPLDEDVKRAGVGGPGTRTLQASRLWQVDRSLAELTFGTSEELSALTRRAHVLAASWAEATGALRDQIEIWETTPSIYPVKGYKTSGFTQRRLHPILGVHRPHNGVDIAARRGTPVVATARGTVTFAGNTGNDFGYMVDIDHGNGIVTRYAHLARGSIRVRVGQAVARWDQIADVGATGLVTAPSVHYEVIVDGRPRNPDQFVVSEVPRF
jgi:murein DD-endopeptidase MepM/ murein hydrolase activator NlpD